ncbi:MAG: DNRLRE domain-containing protein [Chitinophagaceae bacterium]|nr:DNRLRE domain-containing protein [Chitinophagaceae bacterium]
MKKIAAPLLALLVIALTPSCKKIFENRIPKVDAGDNITTTLPEDSVWLSGSATDKDGVIESYQWLKISGPAAAIQNPDSAGTWVKNLKEGTYLFKLIATDDKGYFGSDTVAVTVLPAATETITFQPANNEWEVHLFGNTTGINETDKVATEIGAATGTTGGEVVNIRALLKFNLASIPADAKIVSAKLTLYSHPDPLNGTDEYPNSGSNNAFLIQRVSEAWDFNTITYLNQPASTDVDQVEIPHTSEHFLDVVDVDVKKLIEAMIAEGNNGFLLKLKTEEIYNYRMFVSSKNADASKHPKLEVVYE